MLVGVVHVRQLVERLLAGAPLDLAALAEPAVMVPEGTSVVRLVELFRSGRRHLAVVLDEYGAVEGVVTPADVLTAIAGELTATTATREPDAVQRADGSWLVDGRMEIHRLERLLGRPRPRSRRPLPDPGRARAVGARPHAPSRRLLVRKAICCFEVVDLDRPPDRQGADRAVVGPWPRPLTAVGEVDRDPRHGVILAGSVRGDRTDVVRGAATQPRPGDPARPVGGCGARSRRCMSRAGAKSYRGIVPDGYLDQLSVAGARAAMAPQPCRRRAGRSSPNGSSGSSASPAAGCRAAGATSAASCYLLYVLRASHGRGIGRALFDACHYELARCGHRGLLVWVLADNSGAALLRAARRRARRRELR